MIEIVDATHEDIDEIISLCHDFASEAHRYRQEELNIEKAIAHIHLIIESQFGFAKLLKIKGNVAGGMLAYIDQHWAFDYLEARENLFYVRKRFRGYAGCVGMLTLFERFSAWAYESGVRRAVTAPWAGIDDELARKFCLHAGFEQVGALYSKEFD